MKKQILTKALVISFLTTFSSCAMVEGIFKTRMDDGVILDIIAIGIIVLIINRIHKNK